MEDDFWRFWSLDTGFDKPKLTEAYKAERSSRLLTLGMTRRNEISNLRPVIECINAALHLTKVLETNIYSSATKKCSDFDHTAQITAPFDLLLDTIKPRLILAHGKDAIVHVRQKQWF